MKRTLTVTVDDIECMRCGVTEVPRLVSDDAGARFEVPESWRRVFVLAEPLESELTLQICGECFGELDGSAIRAQFVSWSDGGDVSG